MATIKRFEDLEVWKIARAINIEIHLLIRTTPLAKDFALRDQISRSAGSILDNIAEGFERGGGKEFIQFLSISKASSAEVKSQLYRCADNEYISKEKFDQLYQQIDNLCARIYSLIKYLLNTEYKGLKYKP